MRNMLKRYLDAQASLRMDWNGVTCTNEGKYLMLDGVPVGELGWKWWISKVIKEANLRDKRRLQIEF